MNKKKTNRTIPSIECLLRTGSKVVPLDAGCEGVVLPGEILPGEILPGERLSGHGLAGLTPVTYGQYLCSVAGFLSANSYRALKTILKKQNRPCSGLDTALQIELIGEKHGALYSVARLRIRFADDIRSFAVNCAFSPEQQAFLQVEVRLLARLRARFGLPRVPFPLVSAKTSLLGHEPARFMLFIAEWFENHHEFHLSIGPSGAPAVSVWNESETLHFLSASKTGELYRLACGILTSCLDTRSFAQIYPWHHAAGDFVVDESQDPPSLRLITVRGYRPLLAKKSDSSDKMLGSLHFFVNLSIRMRLDRLDGTGELAWAGPECLAGVIRGFVEAWGAKALEHEDLPKAGDIFSLFLDLSPDERLGFARIAARDGRVEAAESGFLMERLPGHVIELSDALENFEF
jgi:hypothetical protein